MGIVWIFRAEDPITKLCLSFKDKFNNIHIKALYQLVEILFSVIIITKVILLAGLLVFLRDRRKIRTPKLQSTS